MRIECPGCATAYEVPASQIRPGRSVRCACCDRQWLPAPDPVAVACAVVEEVPEAPAGLTIPEMPSGQAGDAALAGGPRVQLRQPSAATPAALGSVTPIVARFGLRLALPAQLLHRVQLLHRIRLLHRIQLLRRIRPPTAWGVGWAASLVVLAGLLVAAGYWRTPIMQGWPPSIRLYVALGAQSPPT